MDNSLGLFKGIIIHHSLSPDGQRRNWDDVYKWHIQENGWEDIAYHFGIEKFNNSYQLMTGRGLQFTGAHCRGNNNTIGICLIGNYDVEPPFRGMLLRLFDLIDAILCLYPHLTITNVHYHNEFADKTCPGAMFPSLPELLSIYQTYKETGYI